MITGSWNTISGVAVLLICTILPLLESGSTPSDDLPPTPLYGWRVVNIFPHDTAAFTQGLIFRDGYLYESTGRRGHSSVRKVRLETGEVLQKRDLEPEYFGEGLTEWEGRLIQITLSSGLGFVYDMQTFELIQTFPITGDGWGLTNNGKRFIMSDGTSDLRFLDPETFQETGRVTVTENGEPVTRINELEMIGERIFANLLGRNEIVIIDPENGNVTGRIDLQRLVVHAEREGSLNVLNGIAYDACNDRIFVTGKLWPRLYEIRISPPDSEK